MPDQWIIRVQDKDYGPVDFDTLREWKSEGRLIPQNPARSEGSDLWTTAAEIPDLFVVAPAAAPPPVQSIQTPPRNFRQILVETFRIYGTRFFHFFGLALLVGLPSVCSQLASAWIQETPPPSIDLRSLVAGAFAFCMLVASIVLWPIYIAAVQILTAETFKGHRIGFLATLNEAVKFWPRVAVLLVFVYGVFFLLTVFALAILAMILAGGSSPFVIFFALALLAVQVWLFGRFFINVLFWQQFTVLEKLGAADSLRESKKLARSGRDLPWYQRPWWRGGLLVSLWIAFILTISVIPQWALLRDYWNQALTIHDPQILLQKLSATEQARGFDLSTFAFGALQKILQPLLGIAFVVLYFDSKARADQTGRS